MQDHALSTVSVKKISEGIITSFDDALACEEPLEIRLVFGAESFRERKTISVTMRTPGNDADLAAGFLFTEGIISNAAQLKQTVTGFNTIDVELHASVIPDVGRLQRNFYTTSSCGVCGKTSIDSIRTLPKQQVDNSHFQIPVSVIYSLPAALRKAQDVFDKTGGLHASALFDAQGNLLRLREDVGRHNALDKLIGSLLTEDALLARENILLLSGRASFELIQKAVMAGIPVVAAIGAPSTLAVELAAEFDITLIGFLRDNRMNVYTGEKRLISNGSI